MGEEYYDCLGVGSGATTDEIAAAYRQRLKETHPDVSDASDAQERTKRLIEAKNVLTDERKRAQYDRMGHDRYVRLEQGHSPDASGPTPRGTGRQQRGGTSRPNNDSAGETNGPWEWGTDRSASTEPRDHTRSSDTGGGSTVGSRQSAGTGRQRDSERRSHGSETEREQYAETGVGEANRDEWEEMADAVWEDVTNETQRTTRRQNGGTAGQSTATTTSATVDWSADWYHAGDASGSADESWTVGGPDLTGEPWRTWSPSEETTQRGRFPPHGILSPAQAFFTFCLLFVAVPLLVFGTAFSVLPAPLRVLFAVFLLFTVAFLIIIPQIGVAVFGSWAVLFPVFLFNIGVSLTQTSSVIAMGFIIVPLTLAIAAWILIRPPAI